MFTSELCAKLARRSPAGLAALKRYTPIVKRVSDDDLLGLVAVATQELERRAEIAERTEGSRLRPVGIGNGMKHKPRTED